MLIKIKSIALLSLLTLGLVSPVYAAEKIYVFAAASTTNVVKELISSYQQTNETNATYRTSFASSSTLARQIAAGADANIFISANVKWYKWLAEKGVVANGTDSIMAANALVLIAAPGNDTHIEDIHRLPQELGDGYLAMGDHKHVPAGMYAKEALDFYGLWDSVKSKSAQYSTVRIALNAVDTQQADFGIVYKTDALQAKTSRIAFTFPAESHTPIQYPVCAIKDKTSKETDQFLSFLKSEQAKNILEKYGFVTQ